MGRSTVVVALAVLLAACAGTPAVEPEQPVAAVAPPLECPAPPAPPVCPEPALPPTPQPLQCPEPVRCPPVPKCPPPVAGSGALNDKLILGAVEVARIQPGDMRLEARIDTGATTTSLHATNVVLFERDGDRWVRFDADAGPDKAPVTLELPWVRRVQVKGDDGNSHARQVITIEVELGGVSRRVEATLNDRSAYEFPLLIGRNFLRDTAVVDVTRTHVLGKP